MTISSNEKVTRNVILIASCDVSLLGAPIKITLFRPISAQSTYYSNLLYRGRQLKDTLIIFTWFNVDYIMEFSPIPCI